MDRCLQKGKLLTLDTATVQVCKEAGVERVVLSTAWGTAFRERWDEKPSPDPGLVEYFTGKTAMEAVVRESGLRYTILRPSWICYNYVQPLAGMMFPELVAKGELAYPHDLDDVRMPHIDEVDIGRFAAAAFLDDDDDDGGGRFAGEEIEMGFENLTARETRDIIARVVTERDVTVRRKTLEEVEVAEEKNPVQKFQLWASRVDVTIDGEALQRKYGIRLTSFEDYVRREKDHFLATIPAKD